MDVSDLHLSIAHALKTLGRAPEAIASYRDSAAARPGFGDAYWSLANLKTYRFPEEEIERMRAQASSPDTPAVDQYHLCFALGKALEDRGEYEASWRYYARGNALKRTESRYRPQISRTTHGCRKGFARREFFETRRGWGAGARDPIFVLGLPRSGSTLIEQILASHSKVEGTQELAEIPRLVAHLQGRDPDLDNPRYPGVLAALVQEDVRRMGEKYLADTRAFRSDRPNFIDKMPNNFRHIGLIQSDPAQRAHHRCAPRADGLLLLQPQATIRQGPGVRL